MDTEINSLQTLVSRNGYFRIRSLHQHNLVEEATCIEWNKEFGEFIHLKALQVRCFDLCDYNLVMDLRILETILHYETILREKERVLNNIKENCYKLMSEIERIERNLDTSATTKNSNDVRH